MNKCIEIPLVLGLSAGILVGEVFGESMLPHGEFVAVSPTPMPNVVVTNTTAHVLTGVYESVSPVEWKIPQDHLVVDTTGFVPPVGNKR